MMSQPLWYTMRQRPATELSGSPMSRRLTIGRQENVPK